MKIFKISFRAVRKSIQLHANKLFSRQQANNCSLIGLISIGLAIDGYRATPPSRPLPTDLDKLLAEICANSKASGSIRIYKWAAG